MADEYHMASAFKGLMVVRVRKDLLEGGMQAGTDSQGRAVLFLPTKGWYHFWVTHDGPEVHQHYDGPHDQQPQDFIASRGPWEPYQVAVLFGASHDSIIID